MIQGSTVGFMNGLGDFFNYLTKRRDERKDRLEERKYKEALLEQKNEYENALLRDKQAWEAKMAEQKAIQALADKNYERAYKDRDNLIDTAKEEALSLQSNPTILNAISGGAMINGNLLPNMYDENYARIKEALRTKEREQDPKYMHAKNNIENSKRITDARIKAYKSQSEANNALVKQRDNKTAIENALLEPKIDKIKVQTESIARKSDNNDIITANKSSKTTADINYIRAKTEKILKEMEEKERKQDKELSELEKYKIENENIRYEIKKKYEDLKNARNELRMLYRNKMVAMESGDFEKADSYDRQIAMAQENVKTQEDLYANLRDRHSEIYNDFAERNRGHKINRRTGEFEYEPTNETASPTAKLLSINNDLTPSIASSSQQIASGTKEASKETAKKPMNNEAIKYSDIVFKNALEKAFRQKEKDEKAKSEKNKKNKRMMPTFTKHYIQK